MSKLTHEELMQRRRAYSKKYYIKNKLRIAKRNAANRGLGFNVVFDNPFDESVKIEYHHIDNNNVVIVPRFIHRLYTRFNEELHRELLYPIIKQIYGDDYDKIARN